MDTGDYVRVSGDWRGNPSGEIIRTEEVGSISGLVLLKTALTGLPVGAELEIEVVGVAVSGAAGASASLYLRYTTDGTEPTITSPDLGFSRSPGMLAGSGVQTLAPIKFRHTVTASGKLNLGVTCSATFYTPDRRWLTVRRVA